MEKQLNIFSTDPAGARNSQKIRILHYRCTKQPESTILIKGKACDRFNYVRRVEIEFDEPSGNIIRSECSCPEHKDNPRLLCRHCLALADHYRRNAEADPIASSLPYSQDDPDNDNKDKSPELSANAKEAILSDDDSDDPESERLFSEYFEQIHDGKILDPSDDKEAFETLFGLPPEDAEEEAASANDNNYNEEYVSTGNITEMKILLGHDTKTDEEVLWYPNDTQKVPYTNTGIIGTMGTGKTQFTKSLVTQLFRNQKDNFDGAPLGILIFDYKGDYNDKNPDFTETVSAKVIKACNIPFNPFTLDKNKFDIVRLPYHTANAFADTIARIWRIGDNQKGVLTDCIKQAYTRCGIDVDDTSTWTKPAPTFETVYDIYTQLYAGRPADLLSNMMTKLHDFSIFEPDPKKAGSLMKLLRGVVVFDICNYDPDIQNLIVAVTLDRFYSEMQGLGSSRQIGRYRQLRKLILVDEADNIMQYNHLSLRKIMKEGRSFGVGVILSTQSLQHFVGANDDYSQYIYTWVIHNMGNALNQRAIEKAFNIDPKNSESSTLYSIINELSVHHSVFRQLNSPYVVMKDKPFWELIADNDQGGNDQ